MADLDKVYEDLLDQFTDVPNWQKYYTALTELTDEFRAAVLQWHARRFLETAEGPQLDVCGVIVGLARPNVWRSIGVFTWDSAVVGERWDEGVWGATTGIQTTELVADDTYRPLLRAKAYANGSGASLYDIAHTINLMFDLEYTLETASERVIHLTFTSPVSNFQRFYIQALAPVQMDCELFLTN